MTYLKLKMKWMLLQADQTHKMTSISLKFVEVVILLVAQLVTTVIFFSAWDESVINETTPKIQPRKWGPKYLYTHGMEYKLNIICFFLFYVLGCLTVWLVKQSINVGHLTNQDVKHQNTARDPNRWFRLLTERFCG